MNWFTTGNEKLHFARLMLEQADAPAEGRSGDLRQPVWCQACLEAAAFHLRGAQLAWLSEVASAHDLGDGPLESLPALLGIAADQDVQSETLNELRNLESNPESWWSAFQPAWLQLWCGRAESARQAALETDRVTIATDAGQADTLHVELLIRFADELETLRERQREAMREW